MAGSEKRIKARSFSDRLCTLFRADGRRMVTTPLFWIMLGIALTVPILVLVMTSMVGGEEGGLMFRGTWQIIAQPAGDSMAMMAAMGSAMGGGSADAAAAGAMDMTSMMNINLVYFMTAVFVCLFIAEDFRSGYVKNLFTVRERKGDYAASKILIGILAGACFLGAFFVDGVLGGAVAGLSFDLGAAGAGGLVMCMIAKIALLGVFVPIFVTMSVIARPRSWMSILLSLFAGMLLFMMIPMMSPLDAGIMQAGLCLAGGAMFSLGLGAVSTGILKRVSLV